MGLLADEFERLVDLDGRIGGALLQTITSVDPKPVRIRRLGPYLARHLVRVRNTEGGRKLVEQWRDWPNGERDDGPDAAATCVQRIEIAVGM